MSLRTFIWLLILALLWGPSFLFVKVAVQEIPPLTLVATRVTIAAAILYVILRYRGDHLPLSYRAWKGFAVVGLTMNALPFVLLSWAQQYIDSALAAILYGTSPLFTVVLAHLFTTDDRLAANKLAGITLGFGGLILLVAPALLDGVQVTLWGLLASIAAAISYGIAMVYARKNLRGLPPLVGPAAQLMMAAVYLVPLSLLIDRPYLNPVPTWPALSSLLLLTLLCTALAFVVYYRAMEWISATTLSMIAYMIPIIATGLGVVVLHERLGLNAYLGCSLIVLGIMAINGLFQGIGWRRWAGAMIKS